LEPAALENKRRVIKRGDHYQSQRFPVGASITTPKSILMGYGFETISTRSSARP
jgi:hypothetical protein